MHDATFWLRAGRLLPRRIRERIFEPAYYDLLADRLSSTSQGSSPARPRFELMMAKTALECLGLGVSGALVHNRRPTRTAWFLVSAVVVSTLLTLMRASYEVG